MAKKEVKPKEVKRVAFTGVDFETPVKPKKKSSKKKSSKEDIKRNSNGTFKKKGVSKNKPSKKGK